jgi:hypothetical protein
VRAALTSEFGFAARTLGQPAYLSEAITAMQHVDGVDYVDVHVFADIAGDITPIQLARLVDGLTVAKPCIPSVTAHFEHKLAANETPTLVAQQFGLSLAELAELNPGLATVIFKMRAPAITVYRGVRPAQLAVLPADVPEALTLRRIP